MRLARWVAALLLVLGCNTAGLRAEPYHLRIGWVVTPSDMASLMFLKPELAPHAGRTYIPELTHFSGTSTAMTALATGELDTASLAYSTFALGVENAGMSDLRIIGDEFQDGVAGYHTNPFLVRNDTPIRTIEDLRGKVLATNETGSAVNMAQRAMLAKHHLSDRDVTFVEVRFPDQKAMLKEGKVNLISAVAPFCFDPELQGFSRTLFTQQDAIGPAQMVMRVVRAGFLEKHRAEMIDFMEDYVHAVRYFLDPVHHDEVVALIVQATKQKPEFYQNWVFTKDDYYRDLSGLPNLDALQKNIDLQHQLGFLRTGLEVAKYADLSVVKEAGARLNGNADNHATAH